MGHQAKLGPMYWSDEELSYLKAFFSSASQKEILARLAPRGWYSVEHKARELGLVRWARKAGASKPLPSWSEHDTVYLAGLFDGEGSIQFVRGEGGAQFLPNIKLDLTMTHESTIAWVSEKWGQNYGFKKSQNPDRWKPAFRVDTQGERACNILERLLPHLITKKEEAASAIAFWVWRRTIPVRRIPSNLPVDLLEQLRSKKHGGGES